MRVACTAAWETTVTTLTGYLTSRWRTPSVMMDSSTTPTPSLSQVSQWSHLIDCQVMVLLCVMDYDMCHDSVLLLPKLSFYFHSV